MVIGRQTAGKGDFIADKKTASIKKPLLSL
jgi:hypothetical protein